MRKTLPALLIPLLVLNGPLSAHEMPTNTLTYSSKLGNLTVESIRDGVIFNHFQIAFSRVMNESDGPQVWEVAVGYPEEIVTGYFTLDTATNTILESSGMDAVYESLGLFRESQNGVLVAEFAANLAHKQHTVIDWTRCASCTLAVAAAAAASALACATPVVNVLACAAALAASAAVILECEGACLNIPHSHEPPPAETCP